MQKITLIKVMKSTGFQVPNPTPPWWPATWPASSGASNRWSQTCECNSPAPHQRETEVAGFFWGGSPNHFPYEGVVHQQNPGPGFGKKAGRFGENPPLNCLTIFCVFLVGWWWKILDENGKNTLVRKNGNIEGMDDCLIIRMPTSPMIFFIKNYYHTPPQQQKNRRRGHHGDRPCGPKKCFVSVDPIDPRRWDHRSDPHPLSQKGKWDPSRRSPVTSRSFGTPTRYVLFCWFPLGKGGKTTPKKLGGVNLVTFRGLWVVYLFGCLMRLILVLLGNIWWFCEQKTLKTF